VEILRDGLPVEVSSCVQGKVYALKYKELTKEVKARISDRVFKVAVSNGLEVSWYRMRRESLAQDWEELQSLYHIRSSFHISGMRITSASQLFPDCQIRRMYHGGGKGASKGLIRDEYWRKSLTEDPVVEEASALVPPVEPEPRSPRGSRSSGEESDINFLDGYRRYRTHFETPPTMQKLALRMESFLGRYVNPLRITKESDLFRAPPGQEVLVKWGKRFVTLEVSLEFPARDIKKWAREHRIAVPILRHEDGTEATDLSIGGGSRLELFNGPRAMTDVRSLKIQEGEDVRTLTFCGGYKESDIRFRGVVTTPAGELLNKHTTQLLVLGNVLT
jgi:hypothetical protein